MFEELKRKIAHYLIHKKHLCKSDETITFKRVISDSREVLILMPNIENDFTGSIEIVKYFHSQKKSISLFLPESKHNSVPLDYQCKFVSYLPVQITRFFLPDKMLLTRLKEKKYDIVIDLNRVEDTFFSCVANVVSSKIRIGFQKNRSEDYYNLLYNSKQNDPSGAYKKFLEHITML